MIGAYILFGGVAATFACISVFFIVFIARGAKYKELSDPDYPRLTLGNPLTALFIERLLTHEGLKFRSTLCKTLMAIWVLVFLAGIVASKVG
jgi:hypothetical protein